MILTSTDESLAMRYAPYIEEVQQLLRSRELSFGAADDLFPFAARLAMPGALHDGMASLVRAIIFREQEGLTQADLLALVTVAVAGPHVDTTAPESRAPVRQILAFLGEALRSLWRQFPEEEEVIPASPAAPVAFEQPASVDAPPSPAQASSATFPRPKVVEGIEIQQEFRSARETVERTQGMRPSTPPRSTVFSRLRAVWRDPDPSPGTYPEYRNLGLFSPHRRPLWIVGSCGLLLGTGLGLRLRDRPPLPSAPVKAQTKSFQPWDPAVPPPTQEQVLEEERKILASLPKPSPDADPVVTRGEQPVAPAAATRPLTATARPVPPVSSLALSQSPPRSSRLHNVDEVRPVVASARSVPGAQRQQVVPSTLAPARPLKAVHPSEVSAEPSLARETPTDRPFAPATAARPSAPGPKGSVFLSVSGEMAGNLLAAPAPPYPAEASAERVEGRVKVQVVVGQDGSVLASRVVSGPGLLREAAQNAVRRWRYRPYLVEGRPTPVVTDVTLGFRLEP